MLLRFSDIKPTTSYHWYDHLVESLRLACDSLAVSDCYSIVDPQR